jgi:hypothetical protein
VTPLTAQDPVQPYIWFSAVMKRHPTEPGKFFGCGARLFFSAGEPETIEGASCHVDLDAALASPTR